MPRGRIRDPEGHQAEPTWGYITRIDGPKLPRSSIWCWFFRKKKIIPFLNIEGFKRGQLVTFDIEKISVGDPSSDKNGVIGIATGVKLEKYR